ncbi:VWA domain-containing protein [Pseudenhygromyxa sp. WMMC2535]|uniref:VWA domain-containing protein n=1 Tax=Pseudenhygromyxa sp. WMMC2535 TaxID=2712867 RepID=UPI001553E11C|nr:vWA domain-containing protein [Pseudenhygromyxa sp. WMMC2535]NVB37009.1 VWA domain-containing protein [Pseudenhygromyxa sp. WMMC2535]
MRRLTIQLSALLALLPALGLGCSASMDAESTPDYAAGDHYAEDRSGYAGPEGDATVVTEVASADDYSYDKDIAAAEEISAAPAEPAPAPAPADGGEALGGAASKASPGGSSGRPTTASRSAKARGKGKRAAADADAESPMADAAIARDELEAGEETAKIAKRERADRNIQSGTLTAGSFDDNLNPWVFDRFVDEARQQPDLARIANSFASSRTVLRVQDKQGRPVADAKVTIDGKQMTSRSDGRVVWVEGWDSGRQGRGRAVIQHGETRKVVDIKKDQIEQMVVVDGEPGTLPSRLDIALVIDATGSMGDELEYLKVEIRDIAEAIAHHFPGVDQRYALVVYRDQGDQYVTRTFDFTGNLDAFQADLADQSANGGGDYPEAMDAAMDAAAQLSWRGAGTARVTFLVADAPPHANKVDDTLDAVDGLRAKGVAVYPVASSGVAGEAEFVMRSAALLTGAQYLFLTDDSGVGNPHAEPHIPCYTVEQLAPLMVRAVRSELSGKRVEAEQQYAIRSVGKGQGGVCEKPRSTAKLAR